MTNQLLPKIINVGNGKVSSGLHLMGYKHGLRSHLGVAQQGVGRKGAKKLANSSGSLFERGKAGRNAHAQRASGIFKWSLQGHSGTRSGSGSPKGSENRVATEALRLRCRKGPANLGICPAQVLVLAMARVLGADGTAQPYGGGGRY